MADSDTTTEKGLARGDICAEAIQRFREVQDAEADERREALDDLAFWSGKQWDVDLRTSRENEGRPCLTINRLSTFVAQVVNEQREKKPAVQVNPVGSGADVETAEILEGLARHIQERSDADVAYEIGYQSAVVTGKGFWRVKTEYADDKGFDQNICVAPIRNRFSVYYDPYADAADYSDARYCLVTEDLPRDEYKRRFPDSAIASLDNLATIGNLPRGWLHNDSVRVAEYWRVETTAKEIKSGDQKRTAYVKKVCCYVINAIEVLEQYDWPGTCIPIVPVIATDVDVNGKRKVWGLVRFARDAQKQYNYMRSAETESIALAPKAPFVGAEGQFEGHEEKWQSANVKNWPYLEYKPVSLAGQPVPPPQRQTVEPPIQAISMSVAQAENDLKATTGIFDASLGAPGPEQSARAILARQNQGGVSSLAFSSGLARAIRATGRIIIEIAPKIYDEPRVEKIVNPDGSAKHIALFNSEESGLNQEQALKALEHESVEKIYDLGVGEYDVTVTAGPSYQSKRQESVTAMMTLINSYPQIVSVAGDILVRNMDWPGSDELANRLHRLLPPQLQQGTDPASQLAQLQQQAQLLASQNQLLAQKLEAATDTILTRKLELESRERIAKLQAETQLVVQELKSRLAQAEGNAGRELDLLQTLHDSAHEVGLAASQPQPTQQPAQTVGG